MMLILSVVLALIPLLGIAYTVINGGGLTIDNLFLVLILLTMSAVFGLNVLLMVRQRRLAAKKAAPKAVTDQKQAAKTS